MPKWRPENEISPEIAAAWRMSDTEAAILGALVVTGGKIRQAAPEVPVAESTAKNAMCRLRRRLQRNETVGLDCGDTDALVRAYLVAERPTRCISAR